MRGIQKIHKDGIFSAPIGQLVGETSQPSGYVSPEADSVSASHERGKKKQCSEYVYGNAVSIMEVLRLSLSLSLSLDNFDPFAVIKRGFLLL